MAFDFRKYVAIVNVIEKSFILIHFTGIIIEKYKIAPLSFGVMQGKE